MSPQRSNRQRLLEGALRCIERLPPERITARVIAKESRANAASIAYHFGSKDALVTAAVVEGLDRWLEEIVSVLDEVAGDDPADRLRHAGEVVEAGRERHAGLARTLLAALARAQHDPQVRDVLAGGFARARPNVAAALGLGDDEAGEDAGGLVLGMFNGLLFQSLLDPALAIEGERRVAAQARLRRALPAGAE